MLEAGAQVEKYEVLEHLGGGGFADVYKAPCQPPVHDRSACRTLVVGLALAVLGLVSTVGPARAQSEPSGWDSLLNLDEVWWFGIDYTHAEFIDSAGFRQPGQIFPAHLNEWNDRFVTDGVAQTLASKLSTDMHLRQEVVFSINARADAKQIKSTAERDTGIPLEDIRSSLAGYANLPDGPGIGVVAMVDRLDHGQERGCVHWVFFDLPTRGVLDAPRWCLPVGGYGFIARWLRPVKDGVARVPQLRKEWRKFARKQRRQRLDPPKLNRLMSEYW